MVRGLASASDVQLEVLAPRADLDSQGKIPADTALASLSVVPLPLKRKWLEAMWCGIGWPKVETWVPDADWIYCPGEAFVATRKASLAVMVHDTHYLEPDLPWSNTPEHRRQRKRWEFMFKPIRRHAKLILAASEFTKSRLVQLLDFNPAKIAVVGNGVEDIYFAEPSTDAPAPGTELTASPYLLVVGGLSRKKGADYLLAFAKKLFATAPHIRIMVTGIVDAPYHAEAEKIGNITMLGYVPTPYQVRLMQNALALLMLSRFEGFGIPAIEAMAVGTVAIVSGFASLPEAVGDAGIVVDAENPDAVLQSVLNLKQNKGYRDQMIARGKHRAAQFHWSAAVAKLIAALKAAG
jgi:glycosyltransferase involved in cell wall biosynthesis